ncbi:MAG: lamin tail domain-containing protein [Chloroflexota bacterium]|nr:lamin tail domain-containing protein [Chloroflexota bacterium]
MRRRGLLFVILNIVVSLAVVLGVIAFLNSQSPAEAPVRLVTVEIRITNTPDPNATIPVRIITTTPLPGQQPTLPSLNVAELPTGLLGDASTPGAQAASVTLDATTIGVIQGDTSLSGTATALPENCIIHVIKEGETPFGIAEIYAADPFQMLTANNLTEEEATFLQIGQTLIVPLPGCPLGAAEAAVIAGVATAAPTATPTLNITSTPTPVPTTNTPTNAPSQIPTITFTPSATVRPTVTLPPTAANAVINIVEVVRPGDVTAEGVSIRNTGSIVSIGGWTLSDADGNTYTFAEQRLFQNAQITLYSRVGTNTPVALYWGRDTAVFSAGDTVTLRDAQGNVQSTYRIPG